MELNLDHNAIQSVALNAFAGLAKLHYVDLSKNHLYYLPIAVFGSNPNMMYLNLQGNPLRYLKPAFLISNTISVLDVSNSRLNHVPEESFKELPALGKLNISNNHIDFLSRSTFLNLTNLQEVDMSNNKLVCDTLMEELNSWLESKHIFTIGSPCHMATNPPVPMFERMMDLGGMPGDNEKEFDDYTLINPGECSCNSSENDDDSKGIDGGEEIRREEEDDVICSPLFHLLAFGNGMFCGAAITMGIWLFARMLKVRAQRRRYNTMQEDLPPAYSDLF